MRDIYSLRNKKPSKELVYDSISDKLKVQIVRIWQDFYNQFGEEVREKHFYGYINNIICDLHGKHILYQEPLVRLKNRYMCRKYFENLSELDMSFDVIEIIFRHIESLKRNSNFKSSDAVKKLNTIFQENDFGYEYVNGWIIRVDNKLLHGKVIDKTLKLTEDKLFENANEEYISSLSHLKNDRNKEALNDSLKAFETTMKIIISDFGFKYKDSDTAKNLINICIENEIIPKYLQSHITGLRTTLESGIPTIRNKRSGHGQGENKIIVPDSLATYGVYMAGVSINFLIELYKDKQS